jgi:hypothetical protein
VRRAAETDSRARTCLILAALGPRADEANSRDTLIVGLIALAISLPVTLFCQSCFEMANDSECPESFLMWGGVYRYVIGLRANRRWHYTGPAGQPRRFVRWYVRSVDAPKPETLLNLYYSLVAFVTRTKPPWTVEAEEAEAEAAAGSVSGSGSGAHKDFNDDDADARSVHSSRSGRSSVMSAVELRRHKRKLTVMGLCGVFLVWAIFAWFIFTYGARPPSSACGERDARRAFVDARASRAVLLPRVRRCIV